MLTVSVITATRNSAATIERNVRCVARQSLRALEHIIIDDGSSDSTAAMVEQLREEYPHVRLIRQRQKGAAAARNCGIEAAGGRYIAFLDSDDDWSDRKLEAQIGFMSSSGTVFSYGDYDLIDARTQASLGRHVAPPLVTYDQLLRGCPIGCLTATYDQHALGKQYMPDVQRGQDWGLWLQLTRSGIEAHRYPGCHGIYSVARRSLSSRKVRKALDIYRIYRRQERMTPLNAVRYLIPHALNAMCKRYDAGAIT